MNGSAIQEYIFRRIREQLSAETALAEVIAETLYISTDSAYRRIRGETLLVLEEARVLCEAFSISLDEVLSVQKEPVSFRVSQTAGGQGFSGYLDSILPGLKAMQASRDSEMVYMGKDIPLFYNFLFRPIFAFRYFFWMKSILQKEEFASLQFSFESLPMELEEKGKEIMSLYAAIPSTEIWNTEAVNSLIAQVEYYREAGYFKSHEDIAVIYKSLEQLIDHVEAQAEAGTKFLPEQNTASRKTNYRLFFNRMVLGDNTILTSTMGKKTVYLSYDVLNFMSTQDLEFCMNTSVKLENLMRKATLLSTENERQRNKFFYLLRKKIPGREAINHNRSL